MLRFFAGLFIGFVLGTTYPNETRAFVKLAIAKTLNLLKTVEKDLGNSQNTPKKSQDFDEDYAPLYDQHRSSGGYEESSF